MAEKPERDRDEQGRFASSSASSAEREAPGGSEEEAPVGPSVGPHTTFDKEPPEVRLGRHEQSDVDAMGRDKRRPVVGGSYSPSLARQATVYGVFIAVVAALAIGFVALANELDQPPETIAEEAPWAEQEAPQVPPRPLDFPRYGSVTEQQEDFNPDVEAR